MLACCLSDGGYGGVVSACGVGNCTGEEGAVEEY